MSKFHASISLNGLTVSGTIKRTAPGEVTLDDINQLLVEVNREALVLQFEDGRVVRAPGESLITVKEIHG